MTVIDAFNYRIGVDATGVTSGAALTRKEMSGIRSTFRSLTEPADKAAQRIDLLGRGLKTGAIAQKDYDAAIKKLRATLPEVAEAEKRRAADLDRASKMTEKYRSSTERLAKELREIDRLQRSGAIDKRTANLARRDAKQSARMPGLGALGGMPGMGMANAASMLAVAGPAAIAVAAVAAVAAAFAAAYAAAKRFWAAMKVQQDEVQKVYRASQALGTSMERLIGLQYHFEQNAGVSGDATLKMFGSLSTKISEAATGAGKATKTFKALKIDPKALAFDDPAVAIGKIFDSIKALENPIDRARAAVKLFGEEGLKLVGVMAQGSDGIQAAADRARELGLVVSAIDGAKVDLAQAALTDVSSVTTGVIRQFTVHFAPAVSAIGLEITSWLIPLTQVGRTGEMVGRVFTASLGILIDMGRAAVSFARVLWNIATLDFKEASSQMSEFNEAMSGQTGFRMLKQMNDAKREAARMAEAKEADLETTRQVTAEGERLAAVESLLGPMRTAAAGANGDSYESMRAQLEAANATTEELAEHARLYAEIEARKKATAVSDTLTRAAEELDMVRQINAAQQQGMDATTARQQIELAANGANESQLQAALAIRRELVAEQQRAAAFAKQEAANQKLITDAERIRQNQRTPGEVLGEEFARLRDMRANDLLSEGEYQRARTEAAAKAIKAMPDATGSGPTKSASFGSAEAYKLMLEERTAQRKKAIEEQQTQMLMANAERVAAAEAKRLGVQQRILTVTQATTAELTTQSQMMTQGPAVNGASPAAGAAGDGEMRTLTARIADAAERTADRLERLEMAMGV